MEYKWVVLTVTTVGIFMATLDASIVFFRLIQGTGAALLFVNSVAIVTDTFAGELGKGIGLNQVAINAGTLTGYVLSGIFIQQFGWRSIFLVNVPVGVFGTFWSRRRLREIPPPGREERFKAL